MEPGLQRRGLQAGANLHDGELVHGAGGPERADKVPLQFQDST